MYPHQNIHQFIEKNIDKDRLEIVSEAREQGRLAKQAKKLKYVENLQGLVFFVEHGRKPVGVSDDVFQFFRPICENLIEKTQLKSEILELF